MEGRQQIKHKTMILLLLAFFFLILLSLYLFMRNKKMYQTIDKILDEILTHTPISQSGIREGQISALADKASRIQETLETELSHASGEKEQVKQLISNMSHQLKTPLTNVRMYNELLQSEDFSHEKQQEFLNKLHTQVLKIDWLLQSLFKMTKLEQNVITFEAGSYPIRETILDAVSVIYEKAEQKEISVELTDSENPVLSHNPKWTAEVFENLLENAVKYTPCKGRITISVHPMEMYTRIEFRDNGIGLDASEYPAVFKRFYRGKNAGNTEGSGIGLYLSKLILEKEKGYLTVSSVCGQGSCFTVFLQNCKN